MAKTCKDCICNELCTTIGFNNGFKGGEQCRHFKDKELFIELPCKVGDDVYWAGLIEGHITSFEDVNMDKSEALTKIYELIKEAFGDSTSVEIVVNSLGIECRPTYTPFTIGHTMRTINGEWIKKER